jgi:hypothetical protein
VQDKKLNKKYRKDKLAIDNSKYIKSVQLIIFVFDYKRLKCNRQLQRYTKTFVKLKR